MKFGDILRELLDTHGLSQKSLAKDLNISAGAIGNYVRNNREPDFETLKRIAVYFRVTTDFLLDNPSVEEEDSRDKKLLEIFHSLPEDQRNLFIEQGKTIIRYMESRHKNTPD